MVRVWGLGEVVRFLWRLSIPRFLHSLNCHDPSLSNRDMKGNETRGIVRCFCQFSMLQAAAGLTSIIVVVVVRRSCFFLRHVSDNFILCVPLLLLRDNWRCMISAMQFSTTNHHGCRNLLGKFIFCHQNEIIILSSSFDLPFFIVGTVILLTLMKRSSKESNSAEPQCTNLRGVCQFCCWNQLKA